MPDFTLNCSRIGTAGGLRHFAEQVMACLTSSNESVDAVLPSPIPAPARIRKIATPAYLSSSSKVSKLRPILWLAYGRLSFPVATNRRILCTTHHVLPAHKHQIVTVHDLRPYFYPDSSVQSLYFHRLLPKALKRCEGVLTVSETSRQMLIEIYGLAESRVRVVPNAITISHAARSPEVGSCSSSTEEEFLLMVGASWAHKNADELLRMHHHWAKRFRLKIVAGEGPYLSQLQSLAAELGLLDRVDFFSALSEAALQSLYARSAALVYPSKMEGFGLPPLEALSYGKPVIVSDIAIFREMYGSFPHYVSLGNEASWGHVFSELQEPDLDYIDRAVRYAAGFSLERMKIALDTALSDFWG